MYHVSMCAGVYRVPHVCVYVLCTNISMYLCVYICMYVIHGRTTGNLPENFHGDQLHPKCSYRLGDIVLLAHWRPPSPKAPVAIVGLSAIFLLFKFDRDISAHAFFMLLTIADISTQRIASWQPLPKIYASC